jgi:hypothetical protein
MDRSVVIDADEIAPGLWMGSAPPFGDALARAGFDVLALCAAEHQPHQRLHPGVAIARAALEDDGSPMMRWHVREAFSIAGWLARRIREGHVTLVTCQQGRNRSGLVTALTLAAMTGASGEKCARAVKERRRSPYGEALCNRDFLDLLRSIPRKRRAGPVTQSAAHEAGLAY